MVGFATDLVHINQLLKAPDRLLDYHFLVIPGGFSYGDDLGAGTLLAKNLTIHLGEQLHRFIEEGRPVLGICNGFQVLVRAGLLPGETADAPGGGAMNTSLPPDDAKGRSSSSVSGGIGNTSLPPDDAKGRSDSSVSGGIMNCALTDNASAQFECRWVTLAVQKGACLFTQGIERVIELPVAHGEGRCVLQGDVTRLQEQGQVPLVYTGSTGMHAQQFPVAYPDNPNGSVGNVAGICNVGGNVLGLMPHPERYVHALQHPQRRGKEGDGVLIFKNAYAYVLNAVVGATFMAPVVGMHTVAGIDHRRGGRDQSGPYAGPYDGADDATGAGADAINVVPTTSYASSGVDIAAADYAKQLMQEAVRSTHGPEVMAGMGAFAGVFRMQQNFQGMLRPALVASTDGVGTKTLVAVQAGNFATIGYDLVNHCVNDLLTQGAKPLFFMDYLAMGKLDPVQAAAIVQGVANACREVGCALLGGETAEMPDVYLPGAFDLAGTIVGIVEQDEVITGASICAGDVLLGLPSTGLHTNGYSLARRVFAPYTLDTVFPELGEPLGTALLRPHRCYVGEINVVRDYLRDRGRFIKGMAHITGGGFAGNVVRILPVGTQAVIEMGRWNVPPLFQLIGRLGDVRREELYGALNMGVGMVLVLSPKGALEARSVLPELHPVGYITHGEGVVLE
jgi:phosphoribosylformylglycinamidine synthase I